MPKLREQVCEVMMPPVRADTFGIPGAHYTKGIECWDYIISQDLGFLAGNIIKYVTRYRHKGDPVRDLEKAKHYLEKLIEVERARQ